MNRRIFLAALGTGVAGLGVGSLFTDKEDIQNLREEAEIALETRQPPLPPNPATSGRSRPEPDVPWVGTGKKEGRTLTVGHSRNNPSDKLAISKDTGMAPHDKRVIVRAVVFWNEYIDQNESFNLSLSFDPAADHEDVDILMQVTPRNPDPQYENLRKVNSEAMNQLGVETLTEEPENKLEKMVRVGDCGHSFSVMEHVASHGLGRMLGYPVWAEPVHVMTPKLNAVLDVDHGWGIYSGSRLYSNYNKYSRTLQKSAPEYGFTMGQFEGVLGTLQETVSDMEEDYDRPLTEMKNKSNLDNTPVLVEAMKKEIKTDKNKVFVEETAKLGEWISDCLLTRAQTNNLEEISHPQRLDLFKKLKKTERWKEFKSRFNVIMNEFPRTDPWDFQVHCYWSNTMWDRHMK